MADARLTPVLRYLYQAARSAGTEAPTDARLLERFCRGQDPEAFAALVRRHGPLVWRVCRRALPQADLAEDVFQATFLVLARKASSLRQPAALASWLHGVAFRLARKVRADLRRRELL